MINILEDGSFTCNKCGKRTIKKGNTYTCSNGHVFNCSYIRDNKTKSGDIIVSKGLKVL